jgi:hypothetical protein
MGNTLTSYSDDNITRDALAKVGSKRTLHEIYGLFYGCMAAPNASDPDEHIAVLLGEKVDGTEEDTQNGRDNLLSLWNFIAQWKPEEDPFYFPEREYSTNYQGVLDHLTDDLSLVQYFIAGLNLGGTEEEDFSEDAVGAMHELMEASTRLEKNIAVCSALDSKAADDNPDSTAEMLDEIEDILADCVAQITIGLKDAKG